LVGNLIWIPAVQDIVKRTLVETIKTVNPDEVVAVGAAIQVGVLAGEVTGIFVLDVTQYLLGETDG